MGSECCTSSLPPSPGLQGANPSQPGWGWGTWAQGPVSRAAPGAGGLSIHHCSSSAWHELGLRQEWWPEARHPFCVAGQPSCQPSGVSWALSKGQTKAGTGVRTGPAAGREDDSQQARAGTGRTGPRRDLRAPPPRAARARDGAPGPAPGLPPTPTARSAALRSAGFMGKAAAPSRGGGCGGRSRGLSSLFTVVPCLSCHTAAPGMSTSTSGSEPEPKPQPQPVPGPEQELLSEQVSEPGFEPPPRSQRKAEPEVGQRLDLLRTGSEFTPAVRLGPFTKAASELSPGLGTELLPAIKPLPLQRPGQAKTSNMVSVAGTSMIPSAPVASLPLDSFKGWLLKWTNYLKGYQRRWFVLGNGLLSYYRNQGEMAHTCRGTINLSTVHIDKEDTCGILLVSGARTYHLKASSEAERQQWITALELAKAKAVRLMSTHSDDSGDDEDTASPADKSELHQTLTNLSLKLDDLSTCNDLIAKHGAALQRSLNELDSLKIPPESGEKLKAVNERATLFRITSNAMINACRDFLELAETHSRKWQRALQYEQEQRVHLEETIEQLAKQHNSLERAFRIAPGRPSNPSKSFSEGSLLTTKGEDSEEDEDTEYFDAMEDSTSFITVITEPKEDRKAESGTGSGSVDWASSDNVNEVLDGASLIPKGSSKVKRRVRIPNKPNYSLNLWSIMKNCIGRELSRIPMPVNFNEPLSMLQRLTEDLEYHHLLDKAVHCTNSVEQMCLVAAFSVSSYSTTVHRIAKPFNPMLGETFELDRLDDMGLRSLCEQVSHHPPAAAHYVFSKHGWSLWQEITISSKFRGKYISIMPLGAIHLEFQASGNHYVWRKSTSTVHNIIVGKLWIDQSGDIEIVNHKTNDRCQMKFLPYSYFSKEAARKVSGVVSDSQGKAQYVLSGSWDEQIECAKIVQSSPSSPSSDGKQKTVYQTLPAKLLWKKYPLPENAENMYYFSELALTLNEHEEGVAPTDSRLRPDQRLMEKGRWDEANAEKQRLEEKQRLSRRRRMEACAPSGCSGEEEKEAEAHMPLWFEKRLDPLTREMACIYKGGYWEAKERKDWHMCPNIF
ncbi:oxysterol-binding protein 2 isoform X6 [Nycticebus coucang]|uniref:oxysterol-binding protein 2 isoform X6 n=1 Tax=Nycticebus coucang TaxID=9470 RepID=UPI00234DD8E1|nr:oxysterol-binding protein 2 isoform X6 [Nycticebus coucang]